jgi:2,4-diketo-3-deoxy-L-fuconate hydrolase
MGEMKLLRLGDAGHERPAILDADGKPRDLYSHVRDIDAAWLEGGGIDQLRKLDVKSLPAVPGSPRVGCPVAGVRKVVAVGLNYRDHAEEAGMQVPQEPILFMKATNTIQGPTDTVVIPRNSAKTDWEVELAIIIGKRAQYIEHGDALSHIAGFCVANDVSERAFQLERGGQWDKGKNCDTFCPLGPWLVTPDELPSPLHLKMWLDVNGERMQNGSTRTMIFDPLFLVHYISQFMTLEPGDVIITGTPPGVGMGRKPPRFLKSGDVMTLGIEGLGEQRQPVKAYEQ